MAVLLQRIAGDQLVLVSDALAPYGLAEGEHRWDERLLLVNNGTCRLEDGTLAGVTLPLLEGSRRLARWSGDTDGAIWASTMAPRELLGESLDDRCWIGAVLSNLLRWNWNDSEHRLNWRVAA